MKFFRGLILFVVALGVNSCKNELKLNAPYKEIPSVYAILNPQDAVQTIRINKVFLGEGDANQMAKVADSVNYGKGDLTVMLERFENGEKKAASKSSNATEIIFEEKEIETNPGAFSTTQIVYTTSERLFTNGVYKLTIKNNKTGNIFTASATAIDSVDGNQALNPLSTAYLYPYPSFAPPEEYIDYATKKASILFQPDDAKYGKVYNLTIRCHYYDVTANGNVFDYVDYNFSNRYSKDARNIGGVRYIETAFKSEDFFSAIGSALASKKLRTDIAGRKMEYIEYLIYTSSQEYIDFLEYTKPSLSFNQNKPIYSNFDSNAAIGIFTFRTRCSLKKSIANVFKSEFAYNKRTCMYQFYTANDQLPGCQ